MFYGYTQKEGTEKVAPFFERFRAEGYRVLFYNACSLGLSMKQKPGRYIDNYVSMETAGDVIKVNEIKIQKGMTRIVGYKVLPCMIKSLVRAE